MSSKGHRKLTEIAEKFYDQFAEGNVPSMELPTRNKSNIVYDENLKVWVYGEKNTTRIANNIGGARKLLKAAFTIEFLTKQLNENRSSTLRELYYISESWNEKEAKFMTQDESNQLIEDLEIVSGVRREDFHMRPEESGATVIGPLKIREKTRKGEREIHCQEDVGEGGYQIPANTDRIKFIDHSADFVMAVETGGMRDRLVENGFDEDYNSIVVHLKGQPARATRRLIKRLNEELNLPVLVFTDGDPWSYRIFGSVAYGSVKSAHLSPELATPAAQFVGIQPVDIIEYDLPSDQLADADINALKSELDDPRFQSEYWTKQIELQLELGKKAEQQALASRGLDFVTEEYLPKRLSEMGII
jgi:DNA topoisomerase-6 subunit A